MNDGCIDSALLEYFSFFDDTGNTATAVCAFPLVGGKFRMTVFIFQGLAEAILVRMNERDKISFVQS